MAESRARPMGGKPFQSKLGPLIEEIRAMRKRRVSYREIATILSQKHGLAVSKSAIFNFVKVRSRPQRCFEIHSAVGTGRVAVESSTGGANDAIERLRRKATPGSAKPVFQFDESKPLTLGSKGK